jgi:hypothetical protein
VATFPDAKAGPGFTVSGTAIKIFGEKDSEGNQQKTEKRIMSCVFHLRFKDLADCL